MHAGVAQMTFARRTFLQGSAASLLAGRTADAADGNAVRAIQSRIDQVSRNALKQNGAKMAIVVGIVTPDSAADGQLLFAGQDTLVNPFGARLTLDAQTPLEIGSISKVFTSGIHYMLRGPYGGTLGESLASRIPLSKAMAGIRLANLANYEPGLAQDNEGGVYPPAMMKSVRSLFAYMADFRPPCPQGTCYAYSNIGWSLLSMASLKIDSTDTDAFVAAYDRYLKQFCAGFGASGTVVFHPGLKPRLPIGYTQRLAPLAAGNDYQPSNAPGYGSGGIVSNGADMLRYLLYNMGACRRDYRITHSPISRRRPSGQRPAPAKVRRSPATAGFMARFQRHRNKPSCSTRTAALPASPPGWVSPDGKEPASLRRMTFLS